MGAQHSARPIDIIRRALTAILLISAATGVGWLFSAVDFPDTNTVIVYLLAILLTARLTHGFAYGILGALAATCAFNYFFTEPYFTLRVNDPEYYITFIVMAVTAIITSALTSKVKQSAIAARDKEAEASALYTLTNRLTDAKDMPDIASIATSTISDIMGCRAAFLCFDEYGQPERSFIQQQDENNQVRREVSETAEIKYRIESLRAAYSMGAEFCDWPIYGAESILGVLRIPIAAATAMSATKTRLLRAMIESIALAMDRLRSMQARIKSSADMVKERYRGNLLRAISHDLRTPLSGIMGTAEMLMHMTDESDARYRLAQGIHNDADWLHSLVENILSLTRLQEGKLTLDKQMEPVEEVIGSAVGHIAKRSPEHEISVRIPDDPLFVPMDARLITQTLVNLIDNAVKHTPPRGEIIVSVVRDEQRAQAVFTVTDSGSGIAAIDLPRIFEMFYTTHAKLADAQRGVGLGLAICEAIVKAHGGAIEANNRAGGQGAEFVFTLPMEAHHE